MTAEACEHKRQIPHAVGAGRYLWSCMYCYQWVPDAPEAEDEDPTAGFLYEAFWDGRR